MTTSSTFDYFNVLGRSSKMALKSAVVWFLSNLTASWPFLELMQIYGIMVEFHLSSA